MADNRTENTGDITTREANSRLLQPTALILRFAQCFIDLIHRLLKRRELGHGVGDLSRPQWIQPLVQPRHALLGCDLAPAFPQVLRIGWQGGLHAHLDRLPGTECRVSEEFGRGTCAQVHDGTVHVRE